MGIRNRDGALFMATGIDNSGIYAGRREAMGIIKAMASEITSFDIFSGIGISAATAFASAAKSSYDFEKEFRKNMLEVATISTQVTNNMTGFMNQVMAITQEIPIKAPDAAKALYQIVSAGHDGADGMKVLEVAARSAIGGITDTVTAADAITTLINAYKMSADDAEKVSDQLFTTARLGKTTFGELGQSVAQVAPIAAAYGVEMDQILAAVATLTKSGTPTAQAMTQIRASIIGTSKVLGDGAFNGRTFQEALEEIAQRAGGSESKLRELIPEVEAVNGVLGMTGLKAKTAAADLAEMNASAGATEAAFKKMQEDVGNQMILLSNNIQATLRPMGEAILKEVSEVARAFNEAFANGDVERSLIQIGNVAKIITGAFLSYKTAVILVTVAQNMQTKAIALNRLASIQHITTTQILTGVLKKQAAAMLAAGKTALFNPYILATAAVASLGYGLYKLATQATASEKALDAHNDRVKELKDWTSDTTSKTDELISVLRDENTQNLKKVEVYNELQKLYPEELKSMSLQEFLLLDVAKANDLLAKSIDNRALAQQRATVNSIEEEMSKNSNRISQLDKKSWIDTSLAEGIELRRLRNRNEQLKIEYDKSVEIVVQGLKDRTKAESLTNKSEENKPLKPAKPVDKKALEARKKLNEELLSLRMQNQQAEINLMAEGREKRLAQIEFDYDSEIAVILAKEKEWKEAQGGKLTEDQTKEVHGAFFNSYVKKEKSATLVDKDQLDAEKKAMNEYLKEYGDYLKKRQAIIELYDEKIAKATTEGDGLSLGKDKERELDAVDDLYLNSAMNRVTMEEDAAYKMLELKQDQFVTDSVYQLKRNALEKKFAQQKMSILKSTNTQEGTERHKQIEDEKKQLAGHLEYLDGYGEKLKGEIIQDALSGLSDIVGAIGGLNDDLGETMQSLQQMIGAVAQLASGNYIGAAVSAITSVVSSIAKSNQEVIQKAKETEGLYWDAVNWKIERQIKLMKELQGISSDQVNQSIQAQIEELMDALYDADFKYKGKSGADMKWMVENIWGGYKNAVATGNELAQKVLEGMAKEIEDNTIGDKKFEDVLKGLTADELISLQGMPDVWRILPEEVRNYIKQLSDAVDKQKELEEETIEMWAGTDVQTAIDDFANALVEAYAQGEDGAIAMADTTKKVLANAVKEALKKKFLADALQGAVTQLGKDMEDGELSAADKKRFEDSANAAGERFTEAMKMYDDLFKGENAEPDREATAKGFATMSQSSADELDGKFASQLIFLDKTLGKVTTISEQMQFIRDLQVKGWEDVRAIRDLTVKVEDNTRQLAEMSEKIENNTDRTARAAESMNDSGIILRK